MCEKTAIKTTTNMNEIFLIILMKLKQTLGI